MKININPDKEFVNDMRKALKDNNGFCPCAIEKTRTQSVCVRNSERWQVEPATAVSIQKQSKTSIRK